MKINGVGIAANEMVMAIEAVTYMVKCGGALEVRAYENEKYIDIYNPNGWDKEYFLHNGDILYLRDEDEEHCDNDGDHV